MIIFRVLTVLQGFSVSAFASITLRTDIELAGGVKASPVVRMKEAMPATITQDQVTLKVVATGEGKDAVKVVAEVFKRDKGTDQFVGKATLIAPWEQPTEVSIKEDDGRLKYRIRVIPSKHR